MIKNRNRLLAFTLSAVMILGLTGCGKKKDKDTTENNHKFDITTELIKMFNNNLFCFFLLFLYIIILL